MRRRSRALRASPWPGLRRSCASSCLFRGGQRRRGNETLLETTTHAGREGDSDTSIGPAAAQPRPWLCRDTRQKQGGVRVCGLGREPDGTRSLLVGRARASRNRSSSPADGASVPKAAAMLARCVSTPACMLLRARRAAQHQAAAPKEPKRCNAPDRCAPSQPCTHCLSPPPRVAHQDCMPRGPGGRLRRLCAYFPCALARPVGGAPARSRARRAGGEGVHRRRAEERAQPLRSRRNTTGHGRSGPAHQVCVGTAAPYSASAVSHCTGHTAGGRADGDAGAPGHPGA